MLDADKTLTHVSFKYDQETRSEKMVFETLKNCSWFVNKKKTYSNCAWMKSDEFKIRVQVYGYTDIPKIKKGDILILGEIKQSGIKSVADLREKYHDSCEVTDFTYNLNSLPYSQHIRITGE